MQVKLQDTTSYLLGWSLALKTKKKKNKISIGEDVGNLEPLFIFGGNVK